MATAAWPLQQAVYTRLSSDGPLTALAGIYDEVPESAPYPHVAVGEVIEEPQDAHDGQGLTVALVLHIWSRYQGYAECAQILAHLDRLLDRRPLAVDGYADVTVFREHSRMMRDPDPRLRHCPARYRVWLSKTS